MSAEQSSHYSQNTTITLPGAHNTDIELVQQAHLALEAVRLVELGARAALVRQLTGLGKKVVKHLYQQCHGRPSPSGQTPFTDAWYRKKPQRLMHANVVWRLFQHLTLPERSTASVLIVVYESYLNLVRSPVLDVTHAAFVPRLVKMKVWRERICDQCRLSYIAPAKRNSSICPACTQYFAFRCRQCGAAMDVYPKGRRRIRCVKCTDIHKRMQNTVPQ